MTGPEGERVHTRVPGKVAWRMLWTQCLCPPRVHVGAALSTV